MASQLSQYVAEFRTCARIAATPFAFYSLARRTAGFHLRNLLGRAGARAAREPEKHRIRIGAADHDLWLRPGTGDLFIFHEIFTNECYRIPTTILDGAQTVVDLGANVGITTIYLSQLFSKARFLCVEPNPSNAEVLRRNLACLGERASVAEIAVADYCGDISFSDSEWSWGGHVDSGGNASRMVSCSTVPDILASHGIKFVDLLKVDIEGAEELIFAGQPDWLSCVGCIIIELHGGYSFSRFEGDVVSSGFTAIPGGSSSGNSMCLAVANRRTFATSY